MQVLDMGQFLIPNSFSSPFLAALKKTRAEFFNKLDIISKSLNQIHSNVL